MSKTILKIILWIVLLAAVSAIGYALASFNFFIGVVWALTCVVIGGLAVGCIDEISERLTGR